ncbi:hypothetical protein BCO37747_08112 [Burkholderia contaminans]|jgi:hypothetical protein|nr:hypothetical protein SK875_A02257 [Burkholderia contaminans]VWC32963.1 hypothetical protein BCO23253_06599 [Burkholderia contaminans]VWD65547.1 hypothetical protein BCO37747_08112 [Burkholderia contaminans]
MFQPFPFLIVIAYHEHWEPLTSYAHMLITYICNYSPST